MKITFVADFMNHHQLPFSENMVKLTEGNYSFVSFTPLPLERADMGYQNMNMLPFVIRAYEGGESYERAMERILNDDMVIFGSCPDSVVEARSETGKPFIIYSERFFKKGTYRRFIPMTYSKVKNRLLRYEGENVSVICSSAYLPYDIKLLHKKFETYKWGYFPKAKVYDDIESLMDKKRPASLLWVARLIKLKHPEAPILVAKKLKEEGYRFNMTLVGVGKMEPYVRKMISRYSLDDCVTLLGAMSPDDVRKNMEEAKIFMFTSDQHEGWGAVVNEAMNSGCAAVTSHAVGSTPFLIENGKNGLVYKSGDIKDLTSKVKALLDNPDMQRKMGIAAYKTINEKWNDEVASERLWHFARAKSQGEPVPVYEDGPISKAEVIYPKYRGGK